jgi:CheY-like chemotaxis protein
MARVGRDVMTQSQMMTHPKTVLVAEDDCNDVQLLELAISRLPADVCFRIVRDGEEALAYLKGEGRFADRATYPPPQVAVLDLRMPKLDGFQVLEWIRRSSEFNGMKVFVWADSQYPAAVEQAKERAADGIIRKPNRLSDLQKILIDIIAL